MTPLKINSLQGLHNCNPALIIVFYMPALLLSWKVKMFATIVRELHRNFFKSNWLLPRENFPNLFTGTRNCAKMFSYWRFFSSFHRHSKYSSKSRNTTNSARSAVWAFAKYLKNIMVFSIQTWLNSGERQLAFDFTIMQIIITLPEFLRIILVTQKSQLKKNVLLCILIMK